MTIEGAHTFTTSTLIQEPSASRAASVVALFEQNAEAHPHKTALLSDSKSVSYRELNEAANCLANHLLDMHLPGNSVVALWLERSTDAVVAMLGVLKAGHAYLPLDDTYPVARIAETLADAEPAVLISTTALIASLPKITARIVTLADIFTAHTRNPGLKLPPNDVAYVMYTSGSTGKPKGVLVSHASMISLFDATRDRFQFNQEDTWTWFHSCAFDFSVWEIWGALLSGARLIVIPFETTRNPEEFYSLISKEHVTVLNQTPAAFHLLNQVEERGPMLPLSVRLIVLGGEALKFALLRGYIQRHPASRTRFVNAYGLTETTVVATMREIEEDEVASEDHSPIGHAIANILVRVLDQNGRPVPDGEEGELWVGGQGLAIGYLKRPELNAQRFVDDPLAPGSRIYRTGDLVRRRPNGDLVYMGRGDDQVKINGFRIELGEVEAVISRFPGVAHACVVAHTAPDGRKQLAAYLVSSNTDPLSVQALANHLVHELPPQMLPASYTRVEQFPLTTSGKIDRKALPEPSVEALAHDQAPNSREPASETEEAVLALVRNAVGSHAIGIEDNFFAIGGHSLLGTQFAIRAREAFGVKVSLRDIFETDTIAELAERIESRIIAEIEAMNEDEASRLAETLPGGELA